MDDYEFRTTAVPDIVEEKDIEKIGKLLEGAKKYFLQQFKPENTLKEEYSKKKSYSEEKLKRFKKIAQPYFAECQIRNI